MEKQTKKYGLLERDLMEFFLQDTGRFMKRGAVEHRVRLLVNKLYNYPEKLYYAYKPPMGIRNIKTVRDLYEMTAEERGYINGVGKATWGKVNSYLKSRSLPPLKVRLPDICLP